MIVFEGLLYRKQGKGTFVMEKSARMKSAKLTGFTEDLFTETEGHRAEVRVLEIREVPAPGRVATMLRIPTGEEVVRFKRVRSLDGDPFSHVINYMVPEIGQKITERELQHHTMLHLLEEKLGIPLRTIRHSVETVKADVEVASLLAVSVFEPVLYMETAVFLSGGRAVETVDTFFRSGRYRYAVELIRSQQLRKDQAKRTRQEPEIPRRGNTRMSFRSYVPDYARRAHGIPIMGRMENVAGITNVLQWSRDTHVGNGLRGGKSN